MASGARGQRVYLGDDVQRSFGIAASAAIAEGDVSPGATVVVSATLWLDVQIGAVRLREDAFTSLFASTSIWLSPSGPKRASVSATVQKLPVNSGDVLLSVGGNIGFPREIASGVLVVPQAGMSMATPTKGGLAPEVFFSGALGLKFETAGADIVLEPSLGYAVVNESLAGGASLGLVVPFE